VAARLPTGYYMRIVIKLVDALQNGSSRLPEGDDFRASLGVGQAQFARRQIDVLPLSVMISLSRQPVSISKRMAFTATLVSEPFCSNSCSTRPSSAISVGSRNT